MLTGQIAWRRGATVLARCFVLFGARDTAAAPLSLAARYDAPAATPVIYVAPSSAESAPVPARQAQSEAWL